MVQLICEGRCNPNLAVADGLAKKYAESRKRLAGFDLAEDMIRAQRSLRYTEHINHARDFSCIDCGTKRKFGW